MPRKTKETRKEEIKRKSIELRNKMEDFYDHRSESVPHINPHTGFEMSAASRLSKDKLSIETSGGVSIPIDEVFKIYIDLKGNKEIINRVLSINPNPIKSIKLDSGEIEILIHEGEAPWSLYEDDIVFALNEAGYKF